MTKVIIKRVKTKWQDRVRDYVILLDGKEIKRISNGSDVEFIVEPGKHTVQMKIDWCSSLKFDVDIAAGESKILECGPNASPFSGLLYIALWKSKYIWLRGIA